MINQNKILEDLKHYKGFRSDLELANFLNTNPSNISRWRKKISLPLALFVQKFPEVDANFLATGQGRMLKTENIVQTTAQGGISINQQNSIGSSIGNVTTNVTTSARVPTETVEIEETPSDVTNLLSQMEHQNETITTLQEQIRELSMVNSKLLSLLPNRKKE